MSGMRGMRGMRGMGGMVRWFGYRVAAENAPAMSWSAPKPV
jgi:hypothetical protein